MSGSARAPGEQFVYILPQEAITGVADDDISLLELCEVVWRAKWLLIVTSGLIGLLAVAYALTATEWYTAEVLLAPAGDDGGLSLAGNLGGMGSLASLAGIRIGSSETAEPIAVLGSRDFTRSFIEEKNLLPLLLADQWDEEQKRWLGEDPSAWPDVRDGIKVFSENVRSISEDLETGLVTLSIEWRDPEIAASWANELVARVNNHLRLRALDEAQRNVEYLQEQLSATNVATLRESIGTLLELELQKLMLAKGNEEFAFRVIDSAQVPKERSRPHRAIIVLSSVFLGGFLTVVVIVGRHGIRRSKAASRKGERGTDRSE